MRVAVLGLIPDAGHAIPLLRIAKLLTAKGIEVKYFGTSETIEIATEFHITTADLGSIKPEHHEANLNKLIRSNVFLRQIFLYKWFYTTYVEKLIYKGIHKLPLLEDQLEAYKPTLLLADNRLFPLIYKKIAVNLGVPIILNDATGSLFNTQAEKNLAGINGQFKNFAAKLLKPIFGKAYTTSKKLFNKQAYSTDEKIHNNIESYWKNCIKLDAENAKVLNISHGIGLLEIELLHRTIDLSSNTYQFGPIPISADAPLNHELIEWIARDIAKPIVYVCFGSMIKDNLALSKHLLEAVKQLHFRVIWANKDNPHPDKTKKTDDFYWASWLPQTTILANPLVKAFVSHAGAGGIQEGIWFGKPMLCIPFWADQFYNANIVVQLGCGVEFEKSKSSTKAFKTKLEKCLNCSATALEISCYFKNHSSENHIFEKLSDFVSN